MEKAGFKKKKLLRLWNDLLQMACLKYTFWFIWWKDGAKKTDSVLFSGF